MASAASQAYTVHRRSLAYIEQMSFRLRNSNSRIARIILIDCEGLESEKKSMLDHSKSMRFGAVHSPGADVFFSHSPVGRKKIVFETGLHMAIKLQPAAIKLQDPSKKCGAQTSKSGSRTSWWKVYFS